jgi:hypothetical protein
VNTLVGLVRPLRVLLWVVGLGYLLWWLSAAYSAILGLSGARPLGELLVVWLLLPAICLVSLDRTLSVLDPYTARAKREKENHDDPRP